MTIKEKIEKNLKEAQGEISKDPYYKYLKNVPLRIICILTIFPGLYIMATKRHIYVELITKKIGLESLYLNEIQKFMPRLKGITIDKDVEHFTKDEINRFRKDDTPSRTTIDTMSSITLTLDNDEKILMSQVSYHWQTGSGNSSIDYYRYSQIYKHTHSNELMNFDFVIRPESMGGKIGKVFRSKKRKTAEVDLENRTLEKAIQFIHEEPVKIRNLFTATRQEKWEENLDILQKTASPAVGVFRVTNSHTWDIANKASESGKCWTVYITDALNDDMFIINDLSKSLDKTIAKVAKKTERDIEHMKQFATLFRLLTEKM